MENLISDRLGGKMFGKDTTIYKFEKIKRAKRAAMQANPDMELIDMGVGEPDAMAHGEVVKVLQIESEKRENRFYSDNGIAEFQEAAAVYMKKRFGVEMDAATQINHCIGSKPALALFSYSTHQPRRHSTHDSPRLPSFRNNNKIPRRRSLQHPSPQRE